MASHVLRDHLGPPGERCSFSEKSKLTQFAHPSFYENYYDGQVYLHSLIGLILIRWSLMFFRDYSGQLTNLGPPAAWSSFLRVLYNKNWGLPYNIIKMEIFSYIYSRVLSSSRPYQALYNIKLIMWESGGLLNVCLLIFGQPASCMVLFLIKPIIWESGVHFELLILGMPLAS